VGSWVAAGVGSWTAVADSAGVAEGTGAVEGAAAGAAAGAARRRAALGANFLPVVFSGERVSRAEADGRKAAAAHC
jgi:hypothetical protein